MTSLPTASLFAVLALAPEAPGETVLALPGEEAAAEDFALEPLAEPAEQNLHDPFRGPEDRVTVVHTDVPPPPKDYGQDPAPASKSHRPFIGGYFGMGWRFGTASRKVGYFFVMRGGMLLGKRLSIGGEMVTLNKRFGNSTIYDSAGNGYKFNMSYGGVQLGFAAVSRPRMRLDLRTTLGGGVACIGYGQYKHVKDYRCVESVKMFVVDPSAYLSFKVFPWVRVGVEVGYRLVARQQWSGNNNFPLAGGYGGINLDFGWFGKTR